MKLIPLFRASLIALAACSAVFDAGAAEPAAAPVPAGFGNKLGATSYAVGLDMVRNFRSQDVAFDLEQLIAGIRDAAAGATPKMSDVEAKLLVTELEGQVRGKLTAQRRQQGESNAKASAEFLRQQAAGGMTKTDSGLLYRIDRKGTGPLPGDSSVVVVNYKGALRGGSTFDASQPDKPASLKLSALIPGWREALKMMPAGSQWHVVVPPQLAYGERGAGNVIGPNEALVFDIELVRIE